MKSGNGCDKQAASLTIRAKDFHLVGARLTCLAILRLLDHHGIIVRGHKILQGATGQTALRHSENPLACRIDENEILLGIYDADAPALVIDQFTVARLAFFERFFSLFAFGNVTEETENTGAAVIEDFICADIRKEYAAVPSQNRRVHFDAKAAFCLCLKSLQNGGQVLGGVNVGY